ncbi:MAG: hypothetical protein M0P16_04130 [Syntrophales bacterium]|nr:hypothetical protein [Syntrophales bacterium]MCK9390787.1 hypothetical protein [Syntrophales bacterium]
MSDNSISDASELKAAPISSQDQPENKRKRRKRPFPAMTFEDALFLANAIQKHASGQKVRRLTLFDAMERSADSSTSRELVTASGQYGITKGAYNAEHIELTAMGNQATSLECSEQDRAFAQFQLAIAKIPPFKALYEAFIGNRMPSKEVMQDKLRELSIYEEHIAEGVETFILNGQFTGVIKELAGAERIVSFEQVLEGKSVDKVREVPEDVLHIPIQADVSSQVKQASDWESICFYITPIGADDSEERHHSDLFMGSIIEPALEGFGLMTLPRSMYQVQMESLFL